MPSHGSLAICWLDGADSKIEISGGRMAREDTELMRVVDGRARYPWGVLFGEEGKGRRKRLRSIEAGPALSPSRRVASASVCICCALSA